MKINTSYKSGVLPYERETLNILHATCCTKNTWTCECTTRH